MSALILCFEFPVLLVIALIVLPGHIGQFVQGRHRGLCTTELNTSALRERRSNLQPEGLPKAQFQMNYTMKRKLKWKYESMWGTLFVPGGVQWWGRNGAVLSFFIADTTSLKASVVVATCQFLAATTCDVQGNVSAQNEGCCFILGIKNLRWPIVLVCFRTVLVYIRPIPHQTHWTSHTAT